MKNTFEKLSQLRKQKKLARALSYKFLTRAGIGPFFSFKTQGVRLRMFPTDMTFEAWKDSKNYRTPDWAFLKRVLKPGDMVVDVGANIGMITMQAAKIVGDGGRVVAIEPNPNIVPFCKANVSLNGFKNVTVIQTALGDRQGETFFKCDRSDDCSHVVENGAGSSEIRVPITTLDMAIKAEAGRPINLLKIDVEGYELVVLEGAKESLKRAEWLYIEVDGDNYSQYGKRPEDVTDLLDSYGFDLYVSDDSGNWKQIRGTISESVNLIGKKRNGSSARLQQAECSVGAV